jgi:hypothetical protein
MEDTDHTYGNTNDNHGQITNEQKTRATQKLWSRLAVFTAVFFSFPQSLQANDDT